MENIAYGLMCFSIKPCILKFNGYIGGFKSCSYYKISRMKWKRLNGDIIEDSIKDAVESAILKEKAKGNKLKICIGSDSQVYGKKIQFATVIVFLRAKKGGYMFIAKDKLFQSSMSLKERMIYEVSKSIEIAYELLEIVNKHNIEVEVHADINTDPAYQSHVAFKEAMGYITGMGFTFKAKPNAFASSSVADKMV